MQAQSGSAVNNDHRTSVEWRTVVYYSPKKIIWNLRWLLPPALNYAFLSKDGIIEDWLGFSLFCFFGLIGGVLPIVNPLLNINKPQIKIAETGIWLAGYGFFQWEDFTARVKRIEQGRLSHYHQLFLYEPNKNKMAWHRRRALDKEKIIASANLKYMAVDPQKLNVMLQPKATRQ
ncbi:hypothetical protein [Hymenobacter sp. B81]|uniref:hypothetical protein n=1 Tax=Hymenobacter sp. B81 TaxID=3344878 RepID=UPI0037DC09AC